MTKLVLVHKNGWTSSFVVPSPPTKVVTPDQEFSIFSYDPKESTAVYIEKENVAMRVLQAGLCVV